jgi:hypothetical protein
MKKWARLIDGRSLQGQYELGSRARRGREREREGPKRVEEGQRGQRRCPRLLDMRVLDDELFKTTKE